jgi:hypothetical protein
MGLRNDDHAKARSRNEVFGASPRGFRSLVWISEHRLLMRAVLKAVGQAGRPVLLEGAELLGAADCFRSGGVVFRAECDL